MAPKRAKSVGNAAQVLTRLATLPDGVGVTELSRMLGLGVSTVHLLLVTLADHGFTENRGDGRYRLGPAIAQLAMAGSGLDEQLRLPLEKLAIRTDEAVSIAIRDGSDAVITQRCESKQVLRADIRIGTRMPLHASASGKCLLAWLSDAEVEAIFARSRSAAATAHAVRKLAELLEDLRLVRMRGYSTNHDEYVEDISAIAAPIRSRAGRIVAALSIAGPTARFRPSACAEILLASAGEMSAALGWTGQQ